MHISRPTVLYRPESSLSPIARPPIQRAEAEGAQDSICPYHKGLIRETGDTESTVFWCPIGRQYWRYSKHQQNGFTTRLRYPKLGLV